MGLADIDVDSTEVSDLLDFGEVFEKCNSLMSGIIQNTGQKLDSFRSLASFDSHSNSSMSTGYSEFDEKSDSLLHKYSMLNWDLETVKSNILSFAESQAKQELLDFQKKLTKAIEGNNDYIDNKINEYNKIEKKTQADYDKYFNGGCVDAARNKVSIYERKLEDVNAKLRGISAYEIAEASKTGSYNPGVYIFSSSDDNNYAYTKYNNDSNSWTAEKSENGFQVSSSSVPGNNSCKITKYEKDGNLVYYKVTDSRGKESYFDSSGNEIESKMGYDNYVAMANHNSNSSDYVFSQVHGIPTDNNYEKGFSNKYFTSINNNHNCGVVTSGGIGGQVKMYVVQGRGYYDSNYKNV